MARSAHISFRAQLPWLFFIARHFCDELLDE